MKNGEKNTSESVYNKLSLNQIICNSKFTDHYNENVHIYKKNKQCELKQRAIYERYYKRLLTSLFKIYRTQQQKENNKEYKK